MQLFYWYSREYLINENLNVRLTSCFVLGVPLQDRRKAKKFQNCTFLRARKRVFIQQLFFGSAHGKMRAPRISRNFCVRRPYLIGFLQLGWLLFKENIYGIYDPESGRHSYTCSIARASFFENLNLGLRFI